MARAVAAAGGTFTEIAGNDTMMIAATGPSGLPIDAVMSMPRQGYGDARYLIELPVDRLTAEIPALEARGLRLEHVFDY